MVGARGQAGAASHSKRVYRSKQPERSDLFELIIDHLETFLVHYPDKYQSRYGYLRAEVRTTLEELTCCGVLRSGFARVVCPACQQEDLVPLSCHRRGLCASCHAKRQLVFAERVLDEILCNVPCRQWTFSLPKALRCFFRFDGTLFRELSCLTTWELTRFIRHLCGGDLEPGFVVCDQTFGTLPDTFHPHQHICATDGGFAPDGRFIPLPRIRRRDMESICEVLRHRVIGWLVGRKKLSKEFGSCMLDWEHSGFSLQASRPIPAGQRIRLERLLMYMARHPFNPKGIHYDRQEGTVTYRANRRHPTRNTATLKTDAVEFIAWLVQHIPHFGQHQVRFYGAASPKVRRRLGLVGTAVLDKTVPRHIARRGRRSWSRLIWKLYGIDPLRCPRCGTERRIISVLLRDDAIMKILNHLDLPTKRPKIRPARAPPGLDPAGGKSRGPLPETDCVDPDYSQWDCIDEEPPRQQPSPVERSGKRSMGILEVLERVPGLMRASELKDRAEQNTRPDTTGHRRG